MHTLFQFILFHPGMDDSDSVMLVLDRNFGTRTTFFILCTEYNFIKSELDI